MKDVESSFKVLSEVVTWADEITSELAQTEDIKDVLDFVNSRKDFLV